MKIGGGRGTFLEKGSPPPSKPPPSPPKTFVLIESLFLFFPVVRRWGKASFLIKREKKEGEDE